MTQIGQIPFLDLLFLKNPLYLKLSQWGLVDSTFPVARFARARMAERLGGELNTDGSKKTNSPTSPEKEHLGDEEDDEAQEAAYNAQGGPPRDLLSRFLAARDARPGLMTDALVQTMAVSMAFAGSETTAISLAAVLYHVLRAPRILARLRAELDAADLADAGAGVFTWDEARALPYLDACVKEAFRLHPAAGLPLERIVPPRGADIAGRFVPGGTVVGCSAWVIHRRPEIWGDDVDTYRPERWLVDEGVDEEEGSDGEEGLRRRRLTPAQREERERKIREMNGMMFQFGMGSRTCIGKNISLLEIYKVVPSLLRRFEVSCPPLNPRFPIPDGSFSLLLIVPKLLTLFRPDPPEGPKSGMAPCQCLVRQAEQFPGHF